MSVEAALGSRQAPNLHESWQNYLSAQWYLKLPKQHRAFLWLEAKVILIQLFVFSYSLCSGNTAKWSTEYLVSIIRKVSSSKRNEINTHTHSLYRMHEEKAEEWRAKTWTHIHTIKLPTPKWSVSTKLTSLSNELHSPDNLEKCLFVEWVGWTHDLFAEATKPLEKEPS